MTEFSRRHFILGSGALALAAGTAGATAPRTAAGGPPTQLMQRARAALAQHGSRFAATDRIGIADFSAPSRRPRFWIVDMESGRSDALLVSHGRGSDPAHTGYVQRFSNVPGSAATSSGAYMTAAAYTGSHGASRRLIGLDPENNNAEARAIVIHPAWYVSPEIARTQGKIGRSEGCFAFSEADIGRVLDRLGPGRLIYADQV